MPISCRNVCFSTLPWRAAMKGVWNSKALFFVVFQKRMCRTPELFNPLGLNSKRSSCGMWQRILVTQQKHCVTPKTEIEVLHLMVNWMIMLPRRWWKQNTIFALVNIRLENADTKGANRIRCKSHAQLNSGQDSSSINPARGKITSLVGKASLRTYWSDNQIRLFKVDTSNVNIIRWMCSSLKYISDPN